MNSRRFVTPSSLTLLGLGAAAGSALGMYLYKHPKLRKQMKKADSVRDAAGILTTQIKHDTTDMAHEVTATMADGVANGLQQTRDVLGLRFLRRGNKKMTAAKAGARHVKNEVKNIARTAKREATHVAQTAADEAHRVKDEALEARDLLAAETNA